MGFSDEDQISMENLYVFKGYGAKKPIKKILSKGWRLSRRNKLLKKLKETDMAARRSGSIERKQNISCFSSLVSSTQQTSTSTSTST